MVHFWALWKFSISILPFSRQPVIRFVCHGEQSNAPKPEPYRRSPRSNEAPPVFRFSIAVGVRRTKDNEQVTSIKLIFLELYLRNKFRKPSFEGTKVLEVS